MARKQQQQEEGAPAWLLTYGDMITLVLTFFVLLFTMSEIKKERVTATMRAFQRQLGVLPRRKANVQVFIQSQRMTETEAYVLRKGPPGRHTSVMTIREDERMKRVLGGKNHFEPNSARLTAQGRELLLNEIAPDLRGFRHRIEIRGHTAAAQYDPAQDTWELAYERAYTVMRFLVEEAGLEERLFRVVSCDGNEPIESNLTPEGREANRRVEVIMTEEVVQDLGEEDRRLP